MIEYLYKSKYESVHFGEETEEEALSELHLHAELYAVTDKYGLSPLADYAKSRFIVTVRGSWDPHGFLESIDAICNLTPESNRGLRDVAVACARSQGKKDFSEG